ncbi:MAG TPA: alanine racemase [Anaeromyxobacteraceae bacterium]|nr:alanine racemase [Anaeromyxobacteraceae bacterium]
MTSPLRPILDTVLDGTWKGFPQDAPPLRLGDVGAQRWSAPRGDLGAAALVLRGPALDHNQRFMDEFLRRTGASLCPHGKTTMAPQLFHRQLADGAWGITVATAQQARVAVEFGVPRVLLANELSHPADVAWLQGALDRDPGLDALVLVDSTASVELLAREARGRRPIPALVELGYPGGRTGARTVAEALAAARAARASPRLQLRGVECFEGLIQSEDAAADAARVSALLSGLWELAAACAAEGLVEADELVVTAGGSAYFDLVALAAEDAGRLALPARLVLRSGCSFTHDSGLYQRLVARLEARLPERWRGPRTLEPAIEIWSRVVSRPEPGLALLAMGKRDVAHDFDLPRPVRWARPAEGVPRDAPPGWSIFRLNDQHAYLKVPADAPLAPGDLVACGISHPCTTLDRWSLLFVTDERDVVTEAVRTFF